MSHNHAVFAHLHTDARDISPGGEGARHHNILSTIATVVCHLYSSSVLTHQHLIAQQSRPLTNSALYAGFGTPAQVGADDCATPPEPDAEALIRLAQQLCEGLGLQQSGGMRSRMKVVDSARPVPASAEAAPCWRAADTTAAMAPAAAAPATPPVPQLDSSAMPAEQPHRVAGSAAGSNADDDVDSLDALLARTQLGPPSLQRLAAEALLPAGMKPQVHAAHQLRSFSSPTAAFGALHASGGSSPSLAHAMAPSSTARSSSEASPGCGVCNGESCGFARVPSSRPDSARSSSGCSICAARQRHAHHTVGALQSGGQAIRSPVTRRCINGRTATADCSVQTFNTSDAASGASPPGMVAAAAAAHTASRKRKPASMSGAKRLCVPASSGATRPTQPAQSDAASAAAADLPWSEQLRRQQARRQPPVGKAQPETAGAAAAAADGLPDSPRHPQEQAPAPAEDDLRRRMLALEAKVASWSLPQVCSDLSMMPHRAFAELAFECCHRNSSSNGPAHLDAAAAYIAEHSA